MTLLLRASLLLAGTLLGVLAVAGLCLLLWLRCASWRALAAPGRALGWLVGSVFAVRRKHVLRSLRAAGISPCERIADGMYALLGRGLLELVWVALHPKSPLSELVQLDTSVLRQVQRRGRGAVLATAHTGNWDLVACAVAAELPLVVITKRLSISWLDRAWQGLRSRRGIQLVQAGHAARRAVRALRRGLPVAMLIDQAPERTRATAVCEFLGRPAQVDLAPALVAMRARVPVVVVWPRRRPDGIHVAEVVALLEPPPRPSRDWAQQASCRMTELLDHFVRKHPEQWLWMHRRWKGIGAQPLCYGGRRSSTDWPSLSDSTRATVDHSSSSVL
jgi:KDO2-lipid IV(A) lauroyltransferase